MDRAVQIVVVFRSEIPGEEDAGSCREAGEEAGQQHRDIRTGGYGGQGGLADIIADNDGVDAVVQVLEDLPQQDRQRERNDQTIRIAFGQIGCSGMMECHGYSFL